MTEKLAAALLGLALALSACSGPGLPSDLRTQGGDVGAEGTGELADDDPRRSGGKRGRKQEASSADEPGQEPGGSGPGARASRGTAGGGGVSAVRDPVGDPERDGDVPSWVDLTGAALRDRGETLVATAAFASSLPTRMPDERHVAQVALHLQLPKENAYLYAEGTPQGWKAYVSRNKKATELPPGSFSIAGEQMSWTVPWASLGDPPRVDWSLHLSWTETTLIRVNYAFDSAPDSGTERLRRR